MNPTHKCFSKRYPDRMDGTYGRTVMAILYTPIEKKEWHRSFKKKRAKTLIYIQYY